MAPHPNPARRTTEKMRNDLYMTRIEGWDAEGVKDGGR
jgi:hypothetical protein